MVVLEACDAGLVARGCLARAVQMCDQLVPTGIAIPAAVRAMAVIADLTLRDVNGFDLSEFTMPLRVCPPRGALTNTNDERCVISHTRLCVTSHCCGGLL